MLLNIVNPAIVANLILEEDVINPDTQEILYKVGSPVSIFMIINCLFIGIDALPLIPTTKG